MHHIYHEGKPGKPVLLLLHGTGGTEQDLLPIADMIDPEASILSVRGNVSENGMPRFFKRLSEGVFDIEDLKHRTQELHEFLNDAAVKYSFDRENVIAIGYSNGANIAGSLLFHYSDSLKAASLHHPMVPLRDKELPDLSKISVFIGAGENDPICPPEETKDLTDLLKGADAHVETKWYNRGHQLIEEEVNDAKKWYESL
ncbi:hypothetical protein KP77_20110 [Jeotgalibacillus alimentarius]|uniref:Phospholipase/carboxylesterase/thioesterase domain-containing protein n=1 Tax=Jeotgalibacillus alimentarius TaxID=135826 RepID=A0A0C2RF13_9BACL|nr:alpha/beta hydrolase [Jeotgalibacillus alimentarius]KIL48800.1 hypothetical protein KP77_20110 [Jeotgalibacillus alimentarius]